MTSLTHKMWEAYILEIQHERFADEIYEEDLSIRRIKKDLEFSCWCDCLIFYLDNNNNWYFSVETQHSLGKKN